MGGSSAFRKWGLVGSNEILRAVSLREYWDLTSPPVLNAAQLHRLLQVNVPVDSKCGFVLEILVCVREEQTQVSMSQLYWSQCGVLCTA